MSMSKRVRMCEKRGARHYKGRVLDPTKEWGPQHTCLTPEDYRWKLHCDWHRKLFGFVPHRPLEGETDQQYLSHCPYLDENDDAPDLNGRRLPDGRWECGPVVRVPWFPPTADEYDPYATITPDERE